jgi:hypothetical protein
MGTALSGLSPQVGGLASAFGTAGGAASGLTTAMGGVGGLVAGGLIAALSVGIRWFVDSRREAEQFEKQLKDTQTAAESLGESLTKLQKQYAAASKAAEIALGVASTVEQQAEVNRLYRERSAIQKQLGELDASRLGDTEEFSRLSGELATKQNQIIKAETQRDRALKEYNADLREQFELIGETEKATDKVTSAIKRSTAAVKEFNFTLKEQGPFGEQEIFGPERQASLDALMVASKQDAYSDIVSLAENAGRELEEINRETVDVISADTTRLGQAWFEAAAVGPKVMLNAVYELAKGHEVSAAKIIETIGDTLWASGMSHVLQAAAIAWIPGLQGPSAGLLQAGLVEMATGLAFGAMGARAGAETGGGAAAARPTRERDQMGPDATQGPVVVNVHALEVTDDTGRKMVRGLDMAFKKKGPALTPAYSRRP